LLFIQIIYTMTNKQHKNTGTANFVFKLRLTASFLQ